MFLEEQRREMVEKLKQQGIVISQEVYQALLKVPRHLFIPESLRHRAYLDTPQSINKGQTISAPHMNAMMSEYLEVEPSQKILEIGTGSGYQAALLSELVGPTGQIFTIERIPELSATAQALLIELGYTNITCIVGDGSLGWESEAPYDRIIVTAACPEILKSLLTQLSPDERDNVYSCRRSAMESRSLYSSKK